MVTLGATPESLFLEFKDRYEWQGGSKKDHAAEVARDVAQFANSQGGVLLVGVSEERRPDGSAVASEIVGIDNISGFKGWVEDAIRNHLTPATFRHPIEQIRAETEVSFLAINVPPHARLIAFWPKRSRSIEYLYRTNHGKSWMNPDEAEAHMLNQLRAVQIDAMRTIEECSRRRASDPQALRLHLVPPIRRRVVDQRNGVNGFEPDPEARARLMGVDDHAVHVKIGTASLRIPFALISAVWMTSESEPAMSLNCRIERSTDGTNVYLDIP